MICFVKNYNLENLKTKLIILYLLNVMDWIFTLYLLGTGFFRETNIFMAKSLIIILLVLFQRYYFVAIILIFIYHRLLENVLSNLLNIAKWIFMYYIGYIPSIRKLFFVLYCDFKVKEVAIIG